MRTSAERGRQKLQKRMVRIKVWMFACSADRLEWNRIYDSRWEQNAFNFKWGIWGGG
jgi:hypothetical protein